MNLSRRDALLGATAAAVVTGAITAPLAIKAASVKAALGGEPIAAQATAQDPVIDALLNELRKHSTRLDEIRVETQAALQLIPAGIQAEYDARPGGPLQFPDYHREYVACGVEALDKECDTVCGRLSDIEAQIIGTPVRTLDGLLEKARVAWRIAAIDYEWDEACPDLSEVPRLDDCVFIWAALQDLERLAGEVTS